VSPLPTHLAPIYAELLSRAEAEPLGLAIRSNNAKQLQIHIANVQRELGNGAIRNHPILACLTPDPEILFLVKRSVELAP